MGVRIQFRRGVQAEIPTLAVGEPGYDVDVKTLRIGDGTSNPPRVPSTKSTGSFDFRTMTDWMTPRLLPNAGVVNAPAYSFAGNGSTGMWLIQPNQIAFSTSGASRLIVHNGGINIGGNIVVSDNGTVDGVDISRLNAANGVLTRIGANTFANRTLTGTANVIRIDNGDGVAGNPIVDMADNPQLPGTGFMTAPAGNTSQRPNPAFDGYTRFNNSPTFRCLEIYVDGRWFQLMQKVQSGSYSISIPGTFNTFNEAFEYLSHITTEGVVLIALGAGKLNLSASNDFNRLPKGIKYLIYGAVPDNKNITGISAVGADATNGGWSVSYTVNSVTGVSVGDYVIVDHMNFDSTMLGEGFITQTGGTGNITGVSSGRDVPSFDTTVQAGISYIAAVGQGRADLQRRMVSTVSNSSALVMSGNADFGLTRQTYMRQVKLTGQVFLHGTDNFRIVGSGTSFLGELNIGDIVNVGYAFATVEQIHSNTEMTIRGWLVGTLARAATGTPTQSPGGLLDLFAMRQGEMHLGTWRVTAVDGISNIVTVNVKGVTAPPQKGLRTSGSTMKVMKTVISGGDHTPFQITDGAQVILQDIAIVRELTTAPLNIAVSVWDGGEVEFRRYVGINGFGYGVYGQRNASISGFLAAGASAAATSTLAISNVVEGITVSNNCYVSLANTYLTSCRNRGILVDNGSTLNFNNIYGDGAAIRSRGLVVANCARGVHVTWGSMAVLRRSMFLNNFDPSQFSTGGIFAHQGGRVYALDGCVISGVALRGIAAEEQSYVLTQGLTLIGPVSQSYTDGAAKLQPVGNHGYGVEMHAGSVVRLTNGTIISACPNNAMHVMTGSTLLADFTVATANRQHAFLVDYNSYVTASGTRAENNRGYFLRCFNRAGFTALNCRVTVPRTGHNDWLTPFASHTVHCQRGVFVDVFGITGVTLDKIDPKPNTLGSNFNSYVVTQQI